MKPMKVIDIPQPVPFESGPAVGVVGLQDIVTVLLDSAPIFGTRAGARRAVAIENAFRQAVRDGDPARLPDDDWKMLKQALETYGVNDPRTHFNPAVARAAEKAGFFALIEEARDS